MKRRLNKPRRRSVISRKVTIDTDCPGERLAQSETEREREALSAYCDTLAALILESLRDV